MNALRMLIVILTVKLAVRKRMTLKLVRMQSICDLQTEWEGLVKNEKQS
jgi:hypothetical protein